MFGQDYLQRVISIARPNLIALFPLNERTGATAADISPVGSVGDIDGVTLANATGPNGMPVGYYDGVNDDIDIDTSPPEPFWAAYDVDEMTCIMWLKVYNAGVWTDSTGRKSLVLYKSNPDVNGIQIAKTSTNNELLYKIERREGGATEQQHLYTISTTSWFCVGVSVSVTGAYCKFYLDGVLVQTAGGVSAGTATDPSAFRIGNYGTSPWYGWIGPVCVWDAPLSDNQMAAIGRV